MLRKLYDRVMALSATRWAVPALAAVSFAEASFFPVPPDVLLGPMVLARQERAWRYAAVCTAGSVLGALFGYAIGVFLTPLANGIVSLFAHGGTVNAYRGWFGRYGFWIILVKGFTPIPFKFVTLASGAFRFDLRLFVLAAVLTRGGRFFLEAALLRHPLAKDFVDRHLVSLAVGGVALVAVAFVLLKVFGH